MSDFDKVKSLLDSLGVSYDVIGERTVDEGRIIKCEEGHEKVCGYIGFMTVFFFDQDDNFIKMGAYED